MSKLIDRYLVEDSNEENRISHSIEFWLYLISNTVSIPCCLFVLFYLLFDRTLRNALHNHIIIVLLILCLINETIGGPLHLYNSYFGTTGHVNGIFYRIWSFLDIGMYSTQLIILSWSIIERYILLFHPEYFLTEKKRLYIHYLPIVLLLFYCICWYSIVTLYPTCLNVNENVHLCLTHNSYIKYFDFLFHQMIPTLIILIGSITLLIRSYSDFSTDQIKERQMIFQIFSLSLLYFIFCGPWFIVLISFQFSSLENIGFKLHSYAYFFSHYFTFLFPFVCLTSLPQIQFQLNTFLSRHLK